MLHLHYIPVTVHRTFNSCRGVISEPDFQFVPEGEILENLKDQNITNVCRITINKNDNKLPARHLIKM